MKHALLILGLWSLLLGVKLDGAATAAGLEGQFRRDLDGFVRARAAQPVQDDAVSKTVEAMVSQVKSSFPGVLEDEEVMDTPTDQALHRAYAELERAGGGARLPVMVSLYADLWKANRINSQQRIIFERLLRAIVAASEKQRKEKKG